jgi:hypothetical protein
MHNTFQVIKRFVSVQRGRDQKDEQMLEKGPQIISIWPFVAAD